MPPWHPWPQGAIARAERTADGRVHLVVARSRGRHLLVTVTGVRARQAEVLAPIAARVRRALGVDGAAALRGTSAFEDAALGLLAPAGPEAVRRVLALGRRCNAAPALRTMPDPADLAALPASEIARRVGSRALARRLQALARAFATRPASRSAS